MTLKDFYKALKDSRKDPKETWEERPHWIRKGMVFIRTKECTSLMMCPIEFLHSRLCPESDTKAYTFMGSELGLSRYDAGLIMLASDVEVHSIEAVNEVRKRLLEAVGLEKE